MENKWAKIFLNPFKDYSEKTLLIVGALSFVGTILISYFGTILFDGIFQIHAGETNLIAIVVGNFSNLIILTLGLFLLAKILYRKVRFVDVLNNILIARIPILFAGLLTIQLMKIIPMKKITQENMEVITGVGEWNMVSIALLAILLLSFIVYFFYLLVVGLRHSINSKKNGHGFLIVGVVFLLDAMALLVYREVFI